MSNRHKVIKAFRNDVKEHLEVIGSEAKKGSQEALLWLAELKAMRDLWFGISEKPAYVYTIGNFAGGYRKANTAVEEAIDLARERVSIAEKAIRVAEKALRRQGLIR